MNKKSYKYPIPDKNNLLDYIRSIKGVITLDELYVIFDLNDNKKKKALQKIVFDLTKSKLLLKNKNGLISIPRKKNIVEGIVSAHRDGFGFVIVEHQEKDIYLSVNEMRTLMDGDLVLIKIIGRNFEKPSGKLIKVIRRGVKKIFGQLIFSKGNYYVELASRNSVMRVNVKKQDIADAKINDFVEINITEYPTRSSILRGEVKRRLGNDKDKGIYTDIAIETHDIPHIWPKKVEVEAKKYHDNIIINDKEIKRRTDLRDLNLITIDGVDAKDFDDAVFCEKNHNGWRLIVAIADVDFYVESSSSLDKEACWRGTSVYFPDRVIPMLPKILSNGLCSLNPDLDRLAIICDMSINETGNVVSSNFGEAIIKSKARLTYSQVHDFYEDNESLIIHDDIKEMLNNLFSMYKKMFITREKRGAIDLDIPQSKIQFMKTGEIENIKIIKRNDAHRLIEECMIAANVEAAKFLNKNKIPALYRNHEKPSAEDFEQLRSYLISIGIKPPHPQHLKPKDYNLIINQAKDQYSSSTLSMTMLRSFKQAVYQAENIGHFGLSLDKYTHFTSPIRRYPDLLVHRAIRHILHGNINNKFHYDKQAMEKYGVLCSERERRAEKATRDVDALLKCQFMEKKIGLEFQGVIISITNFGLFIQLDDILIEGLIHISSLKNDYYVFDENALCLRGSRTAITYNIGDKITIKVSEVDIDMRRITFILADK
tara:strand:+ start:3613 stop:5745 length:2133 start_codon:yes stop_codon:yes gene_type:complete